MQQCVEIHRLTHRMYHQHRADTEMQPIHRELAGFQADPNLLQSRFMGQNRSLQRAANIGTVSGARQTESDEIRHAKTEYRMRR